jgi:hypothetical protein
MLAEETVDAHRSRVRPLWARRVRQDSREVPLPRRIPGRIAQHQLRIARLAKHEPDVVLRCTR